MFQTSLPNSGWSEVIGIVSDTVLRNTVNESSIVTPVSESVAFDIFLDFTKGIIDIFIQKSFVS